MATMLHSPQPFEELPHVADIHIRVRGESREAALARMALVHAQLVSGGGPVTVTGRETIEVGESADLVLVAIDVLRALHDRFLLAGHIAPTVTVLEFGLTGARLQVAYGHYDPHLHGEGLDIKAVTYHQARFDDGPEGAAAELVFDI